MSGCVGGSVCLHVFFSPDLSSLVFYTSSFNIALAFSFSYPFGLVSVFLFSGGYNEFIQRLL